jgi:hypothetical protein
MPELTVFEPKNAREAVQDWALHATRRRKIHEAEARRLDRLRCWLGTLAACLAAAAGTSAFAAWESGRDSTAAGVATAIIGIGAAILGSVFRRSFRVVGTADESSPNPGRAREP